MIDLGTVRPGSTIRIPFSTYDKDDGSAITMTNYAAADLLVYKDGGTTERASTAGFTATTDFDGKTGKHVAVIDLSDNTTAGFWNAGSEYLVALDAVTVDAVTTGGWIARFRIGYDGAMLDTTIASLSSQTSFTLTAGPAEDDALNGCTVIIHDIASAVQCGLAIVLDYTGSTKTVTLAAGTTFTAAAGDNISILFPHPLQATVIGRTVDVSSGGEVGLDWANVGSPTTAVDLSGTTIKTTQKVDVDTIKTNPVVSGGTITFPTNATVASTTNITAGTITTATNLTNAPTAGDFTATMKTSIGTAVAASAVASVTGNVGGNVTGSVGSVATGGIAAASFAAGAIDAAAIAADAIGASELAAGAVDEILDDTIGDGTITVRQALRVILAATAGKLSGAATTTVTIRNTADSADVIVATVDANGNRSAVTVTP